MVDTRATRSFGVAAAAAGLLATACWPHDAAAQRTGGVGGGNSVSRSLSIMRSTTPTNPSTTVAPPAMPPSAIGTPAPQVAPIAPLSPPTTSTFLGSGGATVTTPGGTTSTLTTPGGLTTPSTPGTTATFPGGGTTPGSPTATSASPSESAPSTPGGGAEGYKACMGFWDAQTHMTKREWAASCRRVENRLQNLKSELMKPMQVPKPSAGTVSAYRPMAKPSRRRR